MFSCEQDHTTAAARATFANTGYQPCAAPRSLQPAAHRPGHGQHHQVLPAAVAAALQPRRAKNKKHGASRPSSSSRRSSSTTVVATDVNNFRAMVQELTGFPTAAIFRPLPRRVHAASPFVATAAAAGGNAGQGCSGSEGHGGSEATNNCTAGGGDGTIPDAPAAQAAVLQPPPQCAPVLGVFDGLTDLGSPEFDSWGDLSFE